MFNTKIYFAAAIVFCLLTAADYIEAQKKEIPKTAQIEAELKAKTEQEKIAAENLIYDALNEQGEIAADALIRLTKSNKPIAVKRKIELLEEAFRRASDARHPVKLNYFGEVDTQSGLLAMTLELDLDKLSLQSRAVRAMLSIDRKKAKQMFDEISPGLSVKPVGCKDGFIYPNVDKFYETLDAVLADAFTANERKQNAHIYYAQSYIESIVSPAQVAPVVKTILALKPDQMQLSILAGAFTRALKNVANDDHSFRATMSGRETVPQILNLRDALQAKQLSDRELRDAFRTYLIEQLNGIRCSDGLLVNNQTPAASKYLLSNFLKSVNINLLIKNPITAEEIEPSEVIEAAAGSTRYFDDLTTNEILTKYRKLRFESGTKMVSEDKKNEGEWKIGFSQLLNDLVIWTSKSGTSEVDFFHQKCIFLGGMIEIAPKDDLDLREDVMRSYVSFVGKNSAQRENRAEWLMQSQKLLKLIIEARPEEKTKWRKILSDENNPALNLYFTLMIPDKSAV